MLKNIRKTTVTLEKIPTNKITNTGIFVVKYTWSTEILITKLLFIVCEQK